MTVAELRDLLQSYPGNTEIEVQDAHHFMRRHKVTRAEFAPNEEYLKPSFLVLVAEEPGEWFSFPEREYYPGGG